MSSRVCVLHTAAGLPAVFDPLLHEEAPGVRPYHVLDESLLADTVAHGMLPRTTARLAAYAAHAEAAGARAVLVTCSSVGPAAEAARPLVGIPVLRVDEPMAAEAVRKGPRIGVLATLASTLAPTADLVRRHADATGVRADVTATTCPGAYEARLAGDTGEHDRLIAEEARRLARGNDVLVLAQASMAAALRALTPEGTGSGVSATDGAPASASDVGGVPVLTSPRSGTAQLAAFG